MTLRFPMILIACLVAVGPGCHLPDGRSPAAVPIGTGPRQPGAADVAVRIGVAGMGTKTVPMTVADLATLVVTLKDGTNATVSSPGLQNPITITLPALTGTFTGVPPGTGYTIAVEARNASGTSITANVTGAGSVDVAGGVATYTSGSTLVRSVQLTSGTSSTDTSASAITAATGTTLTFNQFKWMLVNNRSYTTVTNTGGLRATGASITMTQVQPGALSGPTHDLWMFAAQSGSMKALPVQRVVAAAHAAGTVPNPFNGTMAAVTLSTPDTANGMTPAGNLSVTSDDAGNLYFGNTTGSVVKLDAANGFAATTLFTAGEFKGLATDGAGNVYYTLGTDIKMRRPPLYDTDTTVISAADVTLIALDAYKNLYFVTGAAPAAYALNYALYLGGTTYSTVVPTGGATLPAVANATLLAADAYGHVYYSTGTNIRRLTRSSYGFWDGTPIPCCGPPLYPSDALVVTATDISGMAVDRAGDVYFTQTGVDAIKLVPRNGVATDLYTVAGGGGGVTTGQTAMAGDPLTVTEFKEPRFPVISKTGVLFCTTPGDGGALRYLRQIKAP